MPKLEGTDGGSIPWTSGGAPAHAPVGNSLGHIPDRGSALDQLAEGGGTVASGFLAGILSDASVALGWTRQTDQPRSMERPKRAVMPPKRRHDDLSVNQ